MTNTTSDGTTSDGSTATGPVRARLGKYILVFAATFVGLQLIAQIAAFMLGDTFLNYTSTPVLMASAMLPAMLFMQAHKRPFGTRERWVMSLACFVLSVVLGIVWLMLLNVLALGVASTIDLIGDIRAYALEASGSAGFVLALVFGLVVQFLVLYLCFGWLMGRMHARWPGQTPPKAKS